MEQLVGGELRLEAAGVVWPLPGAAFSQLNERASRKVVQPLLERLLTKQG